MDKKTQQNIHDILRSCDNDHAKYLKQQAIAELNYLKLIDLSRGLDAEGAGRLQTNIDIVAKADAKLDDGAWLNLAKYRANLKLAWINSNYMNLGSNLMLAGH